MAETTETFEKRKGIIDRYGVVYEEKMCSFIFLKLIKLGIPFHLCSNLEGAGEFDDIVVRYSRNLPDSVEVNHETLLIQLKYSKFNDSSKPRVASFLKNKPYFDLKSYFESFCFCNRKIQQEHLIFCSDPSERLYLTYTNADVEREMFISEDRNKLNDIVSNIAPQGDVLIINIEKIDSKEEYQKFCNVAHKIRGIISNEVNTDTLPAESRKAIEAEISQFQVNNGYLNKVVKDLSNKPKRNLKDFVQKYEQVDVELLSQFQKQSKVCCLQMDLSELDECIKNELEELLSLSLTESDFAFKKLTKYIKNWRELGDFYLTESSEIWIDIVRSTQQLRFQNLPKKLSSSNIRFNTLSVKQLLTILQEIPGVLNIVSNGELTTFTTLKIWQTVQNNSTKDCVLVHIDECSKDSSIWKIWPNIWCQTLVVECTNDMNKCQWLVQTICEITAKEKQARAIIISPKVNNFYKLFKKQNCKTFKEINDNSSFENLDEDSKHLLSKKDINFQGNMVKLGEIVPHEEMRKLSCDMLSKIISKKIIYAGRDTYKQKIENYVPRFLAVPYIHEDIVKMREKGIVIALETTDEISEKYVKETMKSMQEIDNDKQENNLLHTAEQIKAITHRQGIVTITRGNEKEHFQKLYNEHENVHWIQVNGTNLIWKKSKGDIQKIAGYTMYGVEESEETFILSGKESPIIITAESGMGKTTLVHNMTQSLKNRYPSNWVILITLPKFCNYFREMKNNKIDEKYVVNIIKVSQNMSDDDCQNFLQFPLRLRRFIFLLDAFDEILPDYGEQVMSLIRYLSERCHSVCVTSRKNTESYLQSELSVIPYKLKPLNYDAQKSFISNFWKTKNPYADKKIIDNLASELLQTYLISFENVSNMFTGNPLRIKMLAEIYEEKIANSNTVELGKKLNIMEIFTKFIEKSCARYFQEKRDANLSKPDTQRAFTKFMDEFIEDNMNVSALLIFGENSFDENNLQEMKNKMAEFIKSNNGYESVGIISKILDEMVIYNHRSFAEYFAAFWLADNYLMNDAIIKKRIFKKDMTGVRNFFDFKVSENCSLHTAVLTGDLKHIEEESDINDNIVDKMGRTAMHLSAAYNNRDAARLLITNSSKSCYVYDELHWRPINYAISAHSWEMVNFLLDENRFQINDSDVWNEIETLINEAVFTSCVNSLEHLLNFISRNSNLNRSFLTPERLKGYKSSHKTDVQKYQTVNQKHPMDMQEHQVDVHKHQIHIQEHQVHDVEHQVPDVEHQVPDVEHQVDNLKHLADIQEQIKATTAAIYIPTHLATSFNKINILNLLLENRCDIDVKDKDGYTPLHIASRNGYLNIMEFLIKKGHSVDCYSTDYIQITPLHAASQNGHLDAVKLLTKNHAKIHAKSKDGNTALMMAVKNGHTDVVEYLISEGADVNNVNNDGNNAILLAFRNGHLHIINILERNRADINCINKYGYNGLLLAANYGHSEVVKYWTSSGRNINQIRKYDGDNAAIMAFKNKYFSIVKYCIEEGINIDHQNKNGDSILLLAADVGNLEIVDMCVKKNSSNLEIVNVCARKNSILNQVNRHGDSPLLLASRKGYLEIAKQCVDGGADVNLTNKYEDSALLLASRYGHIEIVKYCVENGANVNYVRKSKLRKDSAALLALENNHTDTALYCIDNGSNMTLTNRDADTALTLAAEKCYFNVVESCIKHNAEVNHMNNAGNTALILAVANNNYKIAEYCMKNKANVNLINKNNDNALLIASKNGDLELVKRILFYGANVKYIKEPRKSSALLIASENGHKNIVSYLLVNGADINHYDTHKNNALLLAIINGHIDIAALCISSNVDINNVNNYGYNALLLASEKGYVNIVKQCVQSGGNINYMKRETWENALFVALENNQLNLVKYLLEMKADVNQVNKYGNTFLLESVKRGNTNIVKNCIGHGGNVNHVNKNGDTALLLACANGYFEIVKYCIEKNANINCVNANGDNVVTLAAKTGDLNIVIYCIEKGADVSHIRAYSKDNAVIIALKRRHFNVAKYCLENGVDVNHQNADGDSAILLAAKEGCLDIVNYCIDKGTNMNQFNLYQYNAALYAAENGHKDIVETCVQHNINLNHVRRHNNENVLQVALKNEHVDIVEYCLDNGANVNHENSKGDTVLLMASRKGILATVKHCIERGANINHVNENGDSALILACKYGYLQIVQYCVLKGADINIANMFGYSTLLTASMYGYMDIVKFCINNKADINYSGTQNRFSVLQQAAESGNDEIVKLCLEKGANVNQVNRNGETALSLATTKGYFNIMKCCTENGANINYINNYGYSPLMIAAESGYLDIVKYLIDKRCDIKCSNENWDNALLLALKNDHFNVANNLIECGSNVRYVNKYGENAFLLSIKKENIVTAKLCVKNGAVVNCTNNNGDSALIIATRKNLVHIVKYLLSKRANVKHVNCCGYSALLLSAKFGYFDVMKLLVKNGADINYVRENSWECALLLAFENKHFDIVKYCLDEGADPNCLNKHRENILMLAAKNGFSDVIEQCIEKIEDIDSENVDGDTALTIAAAYGHLGIVEMCVNHGADINHSRHVDGNNVVLLALQNEHVNVGSYCLCLGVDVNHKNKTGDDVVILALRKHYSDIVKFCMSNSMYNYCCCESNDSNCLHKCCHLKQTAVT